MSIFNSYMKLENNLKRYESVIYCPSAKFKIYTKEV